MISQLKQVGTNLETFWLKDESLEGSTNLAGIFQHARLP